MSDMLHAHIQIPGKVAEIYIIAESDLPKGSAAEVTLLARGLDEAGTGQLQQEQCIPGCVHVFILIVTSTTIYCSSLLPFHSLLHPTVMHSCCMSAFHRPTAS